MDSSDASNVHHWFGRSHRITFMAGQQTAESAGTRRTSATNTEYSDAPDISQRRVFPSMTVHMETSLRRRQECYEFRCFLGTMTVPWIVLTLQCLHHWFGRSYNIYFLWMGKESAGISENSADASATTIQNIRCSRYFAQRRVFHFHDCAHGDGLRCRQECYEFRCFLGTARRCHGLGCSVYITGLDEATTYIWLGKIPQESRKLGGCQCNHRTEYSRFSIFRSTTCPYDCAHGYSLRRRQECYGFRRFLDSARRCHG
jgi:hypothetical protein